MRENIGTVIDRTRKYKRLVVPAGEALFFAGILILSYWLRLDRFDRSYITQITFLLAAMVPAKIVVFWLFRLYHISFRYTSVHEMVIVLKAASVFVLVFALFTLVFRDLTALKGFPRSIIFIDFLLTLIVSSGLRVAFRLFYFPQLKGKKGRKILVVGAGRAGEQLVREMQTSSISHYIPVAFVDDDMDKHGSVVHGVTIEGGREKIPEVVRDFAVDDIIIALPSVPPSELRDIMGYVRASGNNNIKILPGLSHIIMGEAKLGDVRAIAVEDLLGREPVKIDLDIIASYLKGKRVLVTGAAGSIGSELCRQVASFEPASLMLVDMGETELFYISRELKESFPQAEHRAVIGDIRDNISIGEIFRTHSPQVVFHAAAYKHVPLMESNLREAVLNNIGGTKNLADLSIENGVEKFVFISTDKAVNPTSIMGTTKRVSENLLRCVNDERCKFISVRFGNVLESRGSFIPIFKEQIRNGKPVTITHPDMKRYLMSITEAVQLVLQAGVMGSGGEVFVLDMGEPLKILDVAKELIRLSGLEPDKDVPIIFTGIRPGEKLFEELLTAEEGSAATRHEKIFIANIAERHDIQYLNKIEMLLREAGGKTDKERMISMLRDLVPAYKPGR